MSNLDRLSTLMARFSVTVTAVAPADAHLLILSDGDARVLRLTPRARGPAPGDTRAILVAARIDWGSDDSPLAEALPDQLEQPLIPGSDLDAVAGLICAEAAAPRCGAASVLGRLAEILIVQLLRARIEAGAVPRGMLGGLADRRLARAIVAVHDRPGDDWSNDALADVAGMSRSRFMEVFRDAVGQSPQVYLRRWRLALARQDLARGDRIDRVARRYGYGSGEALGHMVRRETGLSPIDFRRG